MQLLIDFLLISGMRISALLIPTWLIKPLWLLGRRCLLYNPRVDIHTAWFPNTLSINFLGFHNEDSVGKRLFALPTRQLV
jgi:hypothetical protein